MEFHFCRRCGEKLTHLQKHVYQCKNEHIIFANPTPANAIVIINDKNEVLVSVRKIDPHKGSLDLPGGFIDEAETIEESVHRELEEELGITKQDYTELRYMTSVLDDYEYKGETVSVISFVFTTRLLASANPVPSDDIADIKFIPIKDIDFELEPFAFNSTKTALRKVMEMEETK